MTALHRRLPLDEFLRRLREQDEMIRRLTEGPLRYLRENEAAIERAQEFARGLDTSAMATAVQALQFDQTLSRAAEFAELTNAAVARLALPESITGMERFASQHREMQEAVAQLVLPHKSISEYVQSMSATMEAAHLAAASLDWSRIGALSSAAEPARALLARFTDRLSLRHADLIASLETSEGLLASASSFVYELPTLGVFVHTGAVRSITPHESLEADEEERSLSLRVDITTETGVFLEGTLGELSPAFLDQYRGAKARSADRGPDWWTQGGSSMRKLLKGVLHTAAPNELVLPWATQNKKDLDRAGRPTRATKVEWLCQSIPNDTYRAYVRTELNSALALIELLDATQHVDEFPEFEQQYTWTILRVEVAIRHILTIWKTRQGR
jgi:hypothetical protein